MAVSAMVAGLNTTRSAMCPTRISPRSRKPICSAEIKHAKTVPLGTTDPRTGAPQVVQHPTLMVLRWEEQKFEMELELKTGKVNDPLTDEATRRLFNRPNIPGANPINLAGGEVPFGK